MLTPEEQSAKDRIEQQLTVDANFRPYPDSSTTTTPAVIAIDHGSRTKREGRLFPSNTH